MRTTAIPSLHKSAIFIIISIFLLTLISTASSANNTIEIDITDASLKKITFAIPYFKNKNQPDSQTDWAKNISSSLGRALEFHGFAKIIDPRIYGNNHHHNWLSLGVNYTILGEYKTEGKKIILELRLMDVRTGRMIIGKRFRDNGDKDFQMIQKFCDVVVYKLTGVQGISSSKITFISDQTGYKEIFVSDILGDNIEQITFHNNLCITPKLSPDNTKIVYTSYHHGNPNLYLIDFKTNKKLTRAISRRPGLNYTPAWSPNGNSLIITMSKDGNPDLYRITRNGVIQARLTENNGINVSPTFSPDGQKIAFVSDRSGRPHIYIKNLLTGHDQRLTWEGTENTTPEWSPDGDWICYTSRTEGTYHIFKIKSQPGAKPIQLTYAWGSHESPTWSPDSKQIAFTRTTKGKNSLYTMSHDGKWSRKLYSLEGNQSGPKWSKRLNFY